MSCDDVLDLIESGVPEDDPRVAEHVAGCAECAALLRGAPAPEGMAGLDAELHSAMERPAGTVERCRQMPTKTRVALVLASVIGIFAFNWLVTRRGDADVFPAGRMWVTVVALVMLGAVSVLMALRPIYKRRPSMFALGSVIGLALLVPAVLAMLPEAHAATHTHAECFQGTGEDFWPRALMCFGYGSVMGVPALLAVFLFHRGVALDRGAWLLGVCVAGAAAQLALQAHCPLVDTTHLLVGHASIPAVFLLLVGLGSLRRAK